MLLKSITLQDFRQFKGTQTVKFADDPSKNVTVIIGENGSGKTTFAQAFMWCLYGHTDFLDPVVLSKDVAQGMTPSDTKTVRVELNLVHRGVQYAITRELDYVKDYSGFLKPSGNARFNVAFKGKDGQKEFIKDNLKNATINEILPEELSKYFFFDGERITAMSKDIQAKGRSNEFAEAVKRLLGLDSYVTAINHLKGQRGGKNTVIGSYNDQYDSKSDSKIAKYTSEIEAYDEKLRRIQDALDTLDNDIPIIEDECKKLEKDIEQNRDSEVLAGKRQSQISQKRRAEEFVANSTDEILKKFHSAYYPFFAKKMMCDAIEALSKADKVDKGVPFIRDKTILFLVEQGKCICGAPLEEGNDAYNHLMELMHFVPPVNIGNEINMFLNTCKNKTTTQIDLFDFLSGYLKLVNEKEETISELRVSIEDIDKQLSGLKSVGQIQNKLTSYRNQLKQKSAERDGLISDRSSIETSKQYIETERQKIALQNEHNKMIEICKSYAERIFEILSKEYSDQEKKTRQELELCINEIFTEIYQGGLSLSIDDKYNIQTIVKDYNDFSEGVETSTAQSISVIFAFIAGVIKMQRKNNTEQSTLSTEPYPLVMDAPLSAFDKRRIESVCNTLPGIAEQVIIFIKDTDGELAESHLSTKIGRKYHFDKKTEFITYLTED